MREKLGPVTLPLGISESITKDFNLTLYRFDDEDFHVLRHGDTSTESPIYLRIESACTFAHLYGSRLCDCEQQLRRALKVISRERGILIYALDQHGRGVGLGEHVKVYEVEQTGLDTVEAHKELGFEVDARNYQHIHTILEDLGVRRIKLLTNNPERVNFLNDKLDYVQRVPFEASLDAYNIRELMIKKEKMGHLLSFKTDRMWMKELQENREGQFAIVDNNTDAVFSTPDLSHVDAYLAGAQSKERAIISIYYLSNELVQDEIEKTVSKIGKMLPDNLNVRIIFNGNISTKKGKKVYSRARERGFRELKIISS